MQLLVKILVWLYIL